MLGNGVCLNNAEMLTNIYKQLGYDAHTVGALVSPKIGKELEYKVNIKRQTNQEKKLSNFIYRNITLLPPLNKLGNHALTIVKNDDKYETYDPTSLYMLNINGPTTASYVGNKREVRLKWWLTATCEEITYESFINIFDDLYKQSISGYTQIELDYLKEIYDTTLNFLEYNKSMLETFYNQNEKDVDVVCRMLVNNKDMRQGYK